MWDPGFHFAEVRLADIEGFQRRLAYEITIGRGTPEHPALMLSLEQRPGRCRGLAFRIAGNWWMPSPKSSGGARCFEVATTQPCCL